MSKYGGESFKAITTEAVLSDSKAKGQMKEKRFTKEASLFNNKSQATNTLAYSSAKIMTTVEALFTTMN
jgi:hypothetical protein